MDNSDHALQDSVTLCLSKKLDALEERYRKLLSEFLVLSDNQELTQVSKQNDNINLVIEKFSVSQTQKFSPDEVKHALQSCRVETKSETNNIENESGVSIADEESITQAQEDAKVSFQFPLRVTFF